MNELLGLNLDSTNLGFLQICLRSIIVFIVTLVMVRVADKRFLGKLSAFDVILGLLLASMMARAVNGSAAFLPTLGGGFVLVFLHRFLGMLSFHSDRVGRLVKGEPRVVVRNGQPNPAMLRALHISDKDLTEELHLNANLERLDQVRLAVLERNGKISVIPEPNRRL